MESYPFFFGLEHGKLGFYGFVTGGNTVEVDTAYNAFNIRRKYNVILLDYLKISYSIDGDLQRDRVKNLYNK